MTRLSMRMAEGILMPHGISDARLRELTYFCYQYQEKRRLARALASPASMALATLPGGTGQYSDPTFRAAARREALLRDLEDIEQAAIDACADFLNPTQLLAYVTTPEKPPVDTFPCGRRQFFDRRRAFYLALHRRRLARD